MIFENEDEKKAFDFIYEMASDVTSQRGCNYLEDKDRLKFGHLKVDSEDIDGTTFKRAVMFDFDVLQWLKDQVKK